VEALSSNPSTAPSKKKQIEIWEMKGSISQIKNFMEMLTSRLYQVEDTISGLEDKVGELQYLHKLKEKI
jgi:hypothetical protein